MYSMTLPWTPRYGVCSWSLRPASVDELLDRVRACGLAAVQLALVPVVEDPVRWGDAIDRLRDRGIAILSGMLATVGEDYSSIDSIARTGGVRPDATWPATLARAEAVARIAGRHGLGLVTFHAGFLPHDRGDPERRRMIDRLAAVADVFAEHGVRVAFETGQEPAETLVEILHELADQRCGVNFDPANMILYGSGDPIAALERLAPWVAQVHLKDALPSGVPGVWGREVALGAGAVDWPRFFAALSRCPQRPDLIVEREAGEERVEDVRRAMALGLGATTG
jgi:sugar phosphate isomerase/epimerase